MGADAKARPREDTTGEVKAASAVRARPSPDRPRLSPEVEARLAPLEARAAARYSALELLAHRARALAEALRAAPADGVVVAVDGPEDSLVTHIDTLRQRVSAPLPLPAPPLRPNGPK